MLTDTLKLVSYKPSLPTSANFTIHCDGATHKANPSNCGGAAISVWLDDKLYESRYSPLVGHITNNTAELTALIHALRWCHNHGCIGAHIRSDSSLAIDIATESCNVKDSRILMLQAAIRHYLYFVSPTFTHVKRDNVFQSFTDFTANLAIFGSGIHTTKPSHDCLLSAYREYKR